MWPNWIGYVTHLSHLLTVFNSSANFFIYLLKHPSFFANKQQATLPGRQVSILAQPLLSYWLALLVPIVSRSELLIIMSAFLFIKSEVSHCPAAGSQNLTTR